MIDTLREITEAYDVALRDYVAGVTATGQQRAYELGRHAIASDVGVVDIAVIHGRVLAKLLADPESRQHTQESADRASAFFIECLSPFERMLRRSGETTQRSRTNLIQVESVEQELRRQNQELLAARQMVEAGRQRYRELFEFAPGGYLVTDLDGIIQEVNSTAALLLRRECDEVRGKVLISLLSEGDRESYHVRLNNLKTGEAKRVEDWHVLIETPDGTCIPVEMRVALVDDTGPMRMCLLWLMSDITERKRLERRQVELLFGEVTIRAERQAAERLQFLADASTRLAASRDFETLPDVVAHLCVPYLAGCCFVHLIEDGVSVRQIAAAHLDPKVSKLLSILPVYEFRERKIPVCLSELLQSGRPEVVREVSPAWLESFVRGEESLAILHGLNLTSALLIPILAQQRVIGTITLFRSGNQDPYEESDLTLPEELARRCGAAFENVRLYMENVLERDKAEKASRAKDEFVAILSHELRTPLTAILGWARKLRKVPSTQTDLLLSEGLKALEQNARTVKRLMEDCLDISRISERKIQLQRELVDLNGVAKAAWEVMKEDTERKEIHCSADLFPEPLWVLGDQTRLEQVLLNLLSNSVKYSGRGSNISIRLSRIGGEGEIAVADTGIGIEPESLAHVFQPFRQGMRHWLNSESGLGLGLTIAREIVHMHHGGMWAESRGLGYGSTFRVRLPLASGPPTEVDDQSPGVSDSEKPIATRVLIVEDAVDVLNLMRIELEDVGFSVRACTGAEAALEEARKEQPDVVVSDIKMPGIHGYDFIKQLRQIPGMATVPAVALTGFGMRSDIEKALESGYDVHLCKPIEVEELTALIKRLTAPR
jgi:PAS domain S-box-containing protein